MGAVVRKVLDTTAVCLSLKFLATDAFIYFNQYFFVQVYPRL